MVSFSLMMGMTPRESRVESVVVAFRYRDRYRWSLVSQFWTERRRERLGTYVGNVVPRHEDLRDRLLQGAKDLIPQRDQPSLTDSSEGLLFADRALLARLHGGEFHPVQSHADGTGRDDDDAVPEGAEGYACLCEGREGRDLREMRRVRLQDGRRACESEAVSSSRRMVCVLCKLTEFDYDCERVDHDEQQQQQEQDNDPAPGRARSVARRLGVPDSLQELLISGFWAYGGQSVRDCENDDERVNRGTLRSDHADRVCFE